MAEVFRLGMTAADVLERLHLHVPVEVETVVTLEPHVQRLTVQMVHGETRLATLPVQCLATTLEGVSVVTMTEVVSRCASMVRRAQKRISEVEMRVQAKKDELHSSGETAARRFFRQAPLEEQLNILRRKIDLAAVSMVTANRVFSQTEEILQDLREMVEILKANFPLPEETSS